MKTETSSHPNASSKSEAAPKVLLGAGIAAAVIIVGLLIYFVRANDPTTRPPIPYQKFNYAQHMQQTQPMDQHTPVAAGSPGSQPAGTP